MDLLKRIFQYKRTYLLLGFPVGLCLTLLAKGGQGWVEKYYARGIHAFFENTIGKLVSLLPFSLTEWLVVFAILGAIGYAVFVVISLCKNRAAWKGILYRTFINVICTASMAYFLFVITMGLSYYRAPASQFIELDVREYSVRELTEVTFWLAQKAGETRAVLPEDENGVMVLTDESFWEISAQAQACFNKISDTYEGIGKVSARSKPMVFSKALSCVMTTGVYFPYTFETNINVDVNDFTIPSTMCHELAHVKGFMREDEANFLGFLACMQSDRADFQYSGYMLAFGYALNQLASEDYEAATAVAQTVQAGVVRDDEAESRYWSQYRNTVVSNTAGEIYETYLESNNQSEGLKSYGKMLDLVIAWYQTEVKNK